MTDQFDTDPGFAQEWLDEGWGDIDWEDALDVIDDAIDYMDEQGYI